MDIRRIGLAFAACVLLLAGTTGAAAAAPSPPSTECSARFFHGDRRLGPDTLPTLGIVGMELQGYHRTGDLTPHQFLDTYWDPDANSGQGSFRYPPDSGYAHDPSGRPEVMEAELGPGELIDRFGSEFGAFLAPEGLPYAARSIPPQSLDGNPPAGCNFHAYRVLHEFAVDAGPIAPWFAQPGGGEQFQLDSRLVPGAPAPLNVLWLIDHGFLQRLT
jgi:hypothetical protein